MEEQLENLREIMNETTLKNIDFNDRIEKNVWHAISKQKHQRPFFRISPWIKRGLTITLTISFFVTFVLIAVTEIDTSPLPHKLGTKDSSDTNAIQEKDQSSDESDNVEMLDAPTGIGLDAAVKTIPYKIELPEQSVIPEDLKQDVLMTAEPGRHFHIVKTLYGKNRGKHIEITQVNNPEKTDDIDDVPFDKINLDGTDAWVYTTQDNFGNRILLWRDGMYFEIQGVDVPNDQLIEVAKSLKPLPYYNQIAEMGKSLVTELKAQNTPATLRVNPSGIVEIYTVKDPDFTYYIDIDRDNYHSDETTITIDNSTYATIASIIGNERNEYTSNLVRSKEISEQIENSYPGIHRGTWVEKNGRFIEYKEDLSGPSILFKIGGAESKPEEVNRSLKALAETISLLEKETD